MTEKIRLDLKGEGITSRDISVDLLARILLAASGFYKKAGLIVKKPINQRQRKLFNKLTDLKVTKVQYGSLILELETPPEPDLAPFLDLESNPFTLQVIQLQKQILQVIEHPDNKEALLRFSLLIPDVNQQIEILRELKRLWPTTDEYIYRVSNQIEARFEKILRPSKHERIDTWLESRLLEISEQVIGALTRIRMDKPSRFYIKDSANSGVSADLTKDIEDTVLDNINKPVMLRGIIEAKKGRRKCKEILSLEPVEEIKFIKKDFPFLKVDLEFFLTYDTDNATFEATNEDLSITLIGESLDDLKEKFELHFEFLILDRLFEEDEKLIPKLREVKQYLHQITDLSIFYQHYDVPVGDRK